MSAESVSVKIGVFMRQVIDAEFLLGNASVPLGIDQGTEDLFSYLADELYLVAVVQQVLHGRKRKGFDRFLAKGLQLWFRIKIGHNLLGITADQLKAGNNPTGEWCAEISHCSSFP